ncbi:MAG: hypothetical protein HZB44_06950 [Actinobacteria bacterium]|nr:hypothetical protein [Actinomycetota bacterium]
MAVDPKSENIENRMRTSRLTLENASPGRVLLVIITGLLIAYCPFAILVCAVSLFGSTWQDQVFHGLTVTLVAAVIPTFIAITLFWIAIIRKPVIKHNGVQGLALRGTDFASRLILILIGAVFLFFGAAGLAVRILVPIMTGHLIINPIAFGILFLLAYCGLLLIKKGVGDRFPDLHLPGL